MLWNISRISTCYYTPFQKWNRKNERNYLITVGWFWGTIRLQLVSFASAIYLSKYLFTSCMFPFQNVMLCLYLNRTNRTRQIFRRKMKVFIWNIWLVQFILFKCGHRIIFPEPIVCKSAMMPGKWRWMWDSMWKNPN